MKKLLLAPLSLIAFVAFAAPAEACERSYGGGVSANCHREYQQSRHYYRELSEQRYQTHRRDARAGYDDYYGGYQPFFGGGYYSSNRVKEKTARRGGEWFQDCGEEIGVVPIGKPCTYYKR